MKFFLKLFSIFFIFIAIILFIDNFKLIESYTATACKCNEDDVKNTLEKTDKGSKTDTFDQKSQEMSVTISKFKS